MSEIDSWLSKYRFKKIKLGQLMYFKTAINWVLLVARRAFAKQKEASFRTTHEGVTEGQQESCVLLKDLCGKRQTINA